MQIRTRSERGEITVVPQIAEGPRDDEKVDTMALGIRAEWSTLQDLDEAGQLARLSLSNPDKVKITELLP